jgi:hypothetical protein
MACFEKVSCFLLCHPGMDVVKKNYDGAIDRIDPTFRRLLDVYVHRVFGPDLEPKVCYAYHTLAIQHHVVLAHFSGTFEVQKLTE